MTIFTSLPERTAVLFDLDGTIIDSRAGIIATIHRVIAELGHEPDHSVDLTWVVGPPLTDLIGQVIAHYGDTRTDHAIALYRAFYQDVGVPSTPLFPHMAGYLGALSASETRLYLATSKPAVLARQILARHGLDACFDAICGANPDDTGAEKPEMIAGILRDYDLPPERCVMIGDRRFDISGAHANAMRAIGVLWGYGGEAELTEAGADAIVTVPDGLPDAIERQLRLSAAHTA